MLALRTLQRGAPRWLATRAASTTPVALVGCGMRGRGMGPYHVAAACKLRTRDVTICTTPSRFLMETCPRPR